MDSSRSFQTNGLDPNVQQGPFSSNLVPPCRALSSHGAGVVLLAASQSSLGAQARPLAAPQGCHPLSSHHLLTEVSGGRGGARDPPLSSSAVSPAPGDQAGPVSYSSQQCPSIPVLQDPISDNSSDSEEKIGLGIKTQFKCP